MTAISHAEALDRVRARKANAYIFADDGDVPNHPDFPLIHYRSPVRLAGADDPAAVFEAIFAANGWGKSWRDGVYPFRHFHTHTHEALGFVAGDAWIEFGGAAGRRLHVKAGDVAVLPAGAGHRRLSASRNLLVVGAYPVGRSEDSAGKYDEPRPGEVNPETARKAIARVAAPASDPVYGRTGPVVRLWVRHRAR